MSILAASCFQGPPAGSSGKASAGEPATGGAEGIDGSYALSVSAELSSERYGGRQSGSPGSRAALDFLETALRDAGLEVEERPFPWRTAYNDGHARLQVSVGATGYGDFSYRRDFREVVRGGYEGGEAEGPLFVYDRAGAVVPQGSIVLLSESLYDPDGLDRFRREGAAGLLIELESDRTAQRPLFAGQPRGALVDPRQGMIVLALTPDAFRSLSGLVREAPAGTPVPVARIASPIRFHDISAVNLVASWNGDGGGFTPSVIVMAHHDHVGMDADGSWFPGALDNASGVGLVTAMALAAAGDRVAADIAFLYTDAEESGLAGAAAFARDPPFRLQGTRALNLDMVGSIADMEIGILNTGDQASDAWARQVAEAAGKAGFRAAAVSPYFTADHAELAAVGAAAASVNEYDQSAYHTKSDTPDGLSAAELDALGDALYALVVRTALE